MQCRNFGNVEMKRLADKLDLKTGKSNALDLKSEQMALAVQYVSSLADETKKLKGRVTKLETASHVKWFKSRMRRSNRRMEDLEANVQKRRVDFDCCNAIMAELKSRVSKLDKHYQQADQKEYVKMSRFSFLYHEHTMFKD